MIDTLNQYDHELMLWMNYDGGWWQDPFWYFVTNIPTWIPLYVVIVVVLMREAYRHKKWAQALLVVVFTALIITAADRFTSGLIKPWAARLRPSHQEGVMEYLHYLGDYRGGQFGFCSSHAANSFALCTWVSLLFRQRHLTCAMVLFALLNCYSRIYAGVHYPGDILVGSIIGILCGWLGHVGYKKASNYYKIPMCGQHTAIPITLTFWLTMLIISIVAFFFVLQ